MTTLYFNMDKNVTLYMELLNSYVNGLKDLAEGIAESRITSKETANIYEEKYMKYFRLFNKSKNIITNIIPIELQNEMTSWSLNYNTSIVTVTIEDEAIEEFYNNNIDTLNVDKWTYDPKLIINEDVLETLQNIYDFNSFDDEFGFNETMINEKKRLQKKL